MLKNNRESVRKKLLRRVKKKRLKTVAVLPSLVTILNGICGFAAISFTASDTNAFALAGYMILIAMIADVLDGRLARMSQSTSSFGGQLDSLCDIISFGVAPAFLMLKILDARLNAIHGISPVTVNFFRRFVWLAAAGYLSCAAIRLARFNVENEQNESSHMSFLGLPTPAAAGAIISLVIFNQEALQEFSIQAGWLHYICEDLVIFAIPPVALALAVLMVGRIRYPHVINQYIKGKKPFSHLIKLLVMVGLILWNRQVALVVIFCGYAFNGFIRWFYYKALSTSQPARQEQKAPSTSP